MKRISASLVSVAAATALTFGAVAPASAAEPTQQVLAAPLDAPAEDPVITSGGSTFQQPAFVTDFLSGLLGGLSETLKGPFAPLAYVVIIPILVGGFLLSLIPGSGVSAT